MMHTIQALPRQRNAGQMRTARSWQEQVIAEYTATTDETRMRRRLAQQVRALTGRTVSEKAIAADARHATAVVDGVRFVLRDGGFVVARPCAYCTTGQIESAPITNCVELGYALVAWQPYHRDCEPADPNDDVSW